MGLTDFVFFFWTGFHYIALAALELIMLTRLTLDSQVYLLMPHKCWN